MNFSVSTQMWMSARRKCVSGSASTCQALTAASAPEDTHCTKMGGAAKVSALMHTHNDWLCYNVVYVYIYSLKSCCVKILISLPNFQTLMSAVGKMEAVLTCVWTRKVSINVPAQPPTASPPTAGRNVYQGRQQTVQAELEAILFLVHLYVFQCEDTHK